VTAEKLVLSRAGQTIDTEQIAEQWDRMGQLSSTPRSRLTKDVSDQIEQLKRSKRKHRQRSRVNNPSRYCE
jgi:hypothetical protein